MRVYFDNCALQRPMDNKAQIRVAVEAEAMVGLLEICGSGEFELTSSEALLFEITRNLDSDRVNWALGVLSSADVYVQLTETIEARARSFVENGIKSLDALHLASAEESQADYFCTCDHQLLRRARSMTGLTTKVVSPLELVAEVRRL